MNLSPGEEVTPTLRLVKKLGAGGMGTVWIADHRTLGTQVVVKFMAAELADDPESLARFSREAAAASQVKSPHVVQIFDHGLTFSGVPFISMELLEGEDLGARIDRDGLLSPREVSQIIGQVCHALGRAHARGIVHRDVKPQNIFLVASDEGIFVKLLDFGIAKANIESNMHMTTTGRVMGSPLYMSPEQTVAAKHIDHRTDLWSLGVVAFEALTNRMPFAAESLGALAVVLHNTNPPVPSTVNPALPKAFDAWFARACARSPDARFQTAKELALALAEALDVPGPTLESNPVIVIPSRPSSNARPGPASDPSLDVTEVEATRPTRRRLATWIIAAFAIVSLAGGGLVATGIAKRRSPEAVPPGATALTTVASGPTIPSATTSVAEPAPSVTTSVTASASVSSTRRTVPASAAPRPTSRPTTTKPQASGDRPLF